MNQRQPKPGIYSKRDTNNQHGLLHKRHTTRYMESDSKAGNIFLWQLLQILENHTINPGPRTSKTCQCFHFINTTMTECEPDKINRRSDLGIMTRSFRPRIRFGGCFINICINIIYNIIYMIINHCIGPSETAMSQLAIRIRKNDGATNHLTKTEHQGGGIWTPSVSSLVFTSVHWCPLILVVTSPHHPLPNEVDERVVNKPEDNNNQNISTNTERFQMQMC